MNTILTTEGVSVRDRPRADLSVGVGEMGGWIVSSPADAMACLDVLSGLKEPEAGSIFWFANERPGVPVLRRLAILEADGGLLANLNLCENIFLPSVERGLANIEGLWERLDHLLADSPLALPQHFFSQLPHQIGTLARAQAAILRAALVEPEAILACEIFEAQAREDRPALLEAVEWLRGLLPNCAWIHLAEESTLPEGLDRHSLGID